MMGRGSWALLALVALPACLDPIVGSECAKGYSPCRGACVAIGSCATVDAAAEVGSQGDAGLDPETGDSAPTIDATALDSVSSNDEAASPDESYPLDADQSETSVPTDTVADDAMEVDAWVADDGQHLGGTFGQPQAARSQRGGASFRRCSGSRSASG